MPKNYKTIDSTMNDSTTNNSFASKLTPIAIGIAAIVIGYVSPAYSADATITQDTKTQETQRVINTTGRTSYKAQDGTQGYRIRNKLYFQDGSQATDLRPQKEEEKTQYNFSTAKQYLDEANKAYKEQNYQKIIDLSEEALKRKSSLKVTEKEIQQLEDAKTLGFYYSKQ